MTQYYVTKNAVLNEPEAVVVIKKIREELGIHLRWRWRKHVGTLLILCFETNFNFHRNSSLTFYLKAGKSLKIDY